MQKCSKENAIKLADTPPPPSPPLIQMAEETEPIVIYGSSPDAFAACALLEASGVAMDRIVLVMPPGPIPLVTQLLLEAARCAGVTLPHQKVSSGFRAGSRSKCSKFLPAF